MSLDIITLNSLKNMYKVEDNIGDIWCWRNKEEFEKDEDNRLCVLKIHAYEAKEYNIEADDYF